MTRLNPHQFPMQLPMFMSANDIRESGVPLQKDDVLDYKLEEADESGLLASVEQHGVHAPLVMEHGYPDKYGGFGEVSMANGHHRFAAQEVADPDRLMPVTHYAHHRWAMDHPEMGIPARSASTTAGHESMWDLEQRIARENRLPMGRPADEYSSGLSWSDSSHPSSSSRWDSNDHSHVGPKGSWAEPTNRPPSNENDW